MIKKQALGSDDLGRKDGRAKKMWRDQAPIGFRSK